MEHPVHGGNLAWAASLAGCSPASILDFSASINPLGPPEGAIAAIQAHLPALRDYPDPQSRLLRQSLSQFHALPADWILPGNGSAELLTWAGRELATLERVYLPVPAFGDYGRALRAFDARVFPLKGWWTPSESSILPPTASGTVSSVVQEPLQFDDLPAGWTTELPPRRCGILLNNPHNPTGHLSQRDALQPYLEEFGLVVVDEAFMDFLPPHQQESVLDWLERYPNLVVLRSLTKFYSLPGLRLGYAIAHPDRLRRWQQWRDPWSVNTLAAAAAIAALQDRAFQQKTWDWLPGARSQLFEGLQQIPGLHPLPGAANFLLVHAHRSTVELQRQLLQQFRVLIRDCVSFPELGDRFFRVAVRTQQENERLLQGLKEVREDG